MGNSPEKKQHQLTEKEIRKEELDKIKYKSSNIFSILRKPNLTTTQSCVILLLLAMIILGALYFIAPKAIYTEAPIPSDITT